MHHKNSIIPTLFMGGFLVLSLAACPSPQDPYSPGATTTTARPGDTTTTTTARPGDTTTTTTTARPGDTTTTTTIRPPGDRWSFVGVGNPQAWTVLKNDVAQGPPTPQLTPVTVRVGDTIEWRVEGLSHGVLFASEAGANDILDFEPGGQLLQPNTACFPGFTWGTDSGCSGFPAPTVLASAKVQAAGSVRFTCELHGPTRMTVDLTASASP